MGVDPLTGPDPRRRHPVFPLSQGPVQGMQNALRVIEEVHQDWKEKTGHALFPID